MTLHDSCFVNSVIGRLATNWLGGSGIYTEFEAPDWSAHAFVEKTVPVVLDDRHEFIP